MRVMAGCQDFVSAQELHILLVADTHSIGLTCARSRPVDSEVVEQWAGRVAADIGFGAVEHTVELIGICAECRPSGDEGEEPPCHWDHAPDRRGRARSCAS
ncbi:hypothetical protein [Streptomyces mirabilis]|uniref:hypothetical protein n=1 Tax=Streptomyces mirabilis TaxID=68239 RepID=UPI0036C53871